MRTPEIRSGDAADAQRVKEQLAGPAADARELAVKLGLSPRPVNYWVVSYDEMRGLIARQGFQQRYPHWRWGMQYKQQERQEFLGGKAFEIVNNSEPAHAFLQVSNSLTDQKSVITHVEAHSDFFANNQWFQLFDAAPDAARMLAQHAEKIESYMDDPEVGRDAVEKWIDNILTVEMQIDQWSKYEALEAYVEASYNQAPGEDADAMSRENRVAELDLPEEVEAHVFEEWIEAEDDEEVPGAVPVPEYDLLAVLYAFGQQFDEDSGQAVPMEDWQRDVLAMLREESYYFAPQQLSKIMNEGWAAYWESTMMTEELVADDDQFVSYADKQSRVLNSPGVNPYALGQSLWEYVENRANRTEVIKRLLQVDGITWRNFHDAIDFEHVLDELEPPASIAATDNTTLDAVAALPDRYVDTPNLERAYNGDIDVTNQPWKVLTHDALVERHYSLIKPANRSFLADASTTRVEELSRYILEPDRYDTVDAALADVDKEAGWERMFDVRENKNDVTFIDEYLTQEFVDAHGMYTAEFSNLTGAFHAASTDVEDVRKKLLLDTANFGKPRVGVRDINYRNKGELLLGHEYNGIRMDLDQLKDVMVRLFELWGRPVNVKTIDKRIPDQGVSDPMETVEEPEPDEVPLRIRYDGDEFSERELPESEIEHLRSDDIDYDTTPDQWPGS